MQAMLIQNAQAVISGELISGVSIEIRDGIIAGIHDGAPAGFGGEKIDGSGSTVMPGCIDVHIHGAAGADVNEADVEGLLKVAEFLATKGVTAWVPTLVPDSDENYRRVIDVIDRLMEIQEHYPVAKAVGVHYEGIFANENMCGALRPRFFKKFTGKELDRLPRLKRGVHMTTFAPEIEGGIELAAELRKQGWVASIGHTRASVEILENACEAGARHITHFFNAMTGIHHRDLGVAGWALANKGVTFDIIADGIHSDERMLAVACRAKTPDMVTLISDSVAPTGLGDGEFELWGEKFSVTGGRTRNERGSIAGSVITMLDAVKRMIRLGFSYSEAAKMASANPARLLGLGDRGSIVAGKRADLVALDASGDIKFVMIGGGAVGAK